MDPVILDTSPAQGLHLLAGCLRAHLVAAMVVMSNVSLADVLAFLSTPRKQRCLEVIVTYDDRDDQRLFYAAGLGELKAAWASEETAAEHRVYVSLSAASVRQRCSLEACSAPHAIWRKVIIVKMICTRPRVEFCLWLDSDASVVPKPNRFVGGNKCKEKELRFHDLKDIWASMLADRYEVSFLGYRQDGAGHQGYREDGAGNQCVGRVDFGNECPCA